MVPTGFDAYGVYRAILGKCRLRYRLSHIEIAVVASIVAVATSSISTIVLIERRQNVIREAIKRRKNFFQKGKFGFNQLIT